MTVLDASVVVSVLTPTDAHHDASLRWYRRWAQSGDSLDVAPILYVELAGAIARAAGSSMAGHRAVRTIRTLPQTRPIDLDDVLRQRSIRFAADLQLRGADAVYVATAHLLGVPLVTWDDQQFQRASAVITVYRPSL